jgi:hypothetical protein
VVSSTTGTTDHSLASEIISYDQVNKISIPEAQLDPNDFLFPSQSEIFRAAEYLFARELRAIFFNCASHLPRRRIRFWGIDLRSGDACNSHRLGINRRVDESASERCGVSRQSRRSRIIRYEAGAAASRRPRFMEHDAKGVRGHDT